MSNQEIIGKFYNQIWNSGNKDASYEILHEDFIFRGSTGLEKRGISSFLDYVDLIFRALSDYRCTIQEIVSEGNRSVAKMTFSGKQTGIFFEISPSGKTLTWYGAAFFQFEGLKIKELWVLGDVDSLKQQLGIARQLSP